jgi:hypothetical protein
MQPETKSSRMQRMSHRDLRNSVFRPNGRHDTPARVGVNLALAHGLLTLFGWSSIVVMVEL